MSLLLLFNSPPPAGGVAQELAATAASTSTLTGRFLIDLKGTSAATSTTAGALAIDLKGTSASTSTLTGKLAIDLKASTAGSSAMTGVWVRTANLAGQSDAASDGNATIQLEQQLAGQSDATSGATGTIFTGISGVATSQSATTGDLGINYVMPGGTSEGMSIMGSAQYPSATFYPSPDVYPGVNTTVLNVTWGLQGTSSSTSRMSGGTTALAGTSRGQSAMGSWVLPSTSQYPSTSLFPGTIAPDLHVTELAQGEVLITLTASVDVKITLTAVADVSGTLQSNALLVTLGAS